MLGTLRFLLRSPHADDVSGRRKEKALRLLDARRRLAAEHLEHRRLLVVTGLGLAGDSLTDEYFDASYSYALNWVSLIGQERSADVPLGELKLSPDSWGEPRRQGYEYNWARSGADSSTLLSQAQHTGVAQDLTDGDISHAVLAIGQNDFFPFPGSGAYYEIYNGNWNQTQIDAYTTGVLANIQTAANTILAEDAQLVMSNIIDYGVAPFTAIAGFTNAAQRQLVTDVISDLNDDIAAFAATNRIPLVDGFNFAADLLANPSFSFGGVVINNGGGVAANNAFVNDSIHPHTVTSSILANAFLNAMNVGHHENIPLFTEEEILDLVGLTYVSDTFAFDYNDYLIWVPQTTGVFSHDPGTSDGYTLFSPNTTNTTNLIDKDGNLINQWTSAYQPGLIAYLLEDGSLIRASAPNGQGGNGFINAAGSGGLIERFDWAGNKTWEFTYDSPTVLQHHDIEIMPNGNLLLIAWEFKSEAEATQAGRDPALPGAGYLYPDHIVEIEPDLDAGVGGTIVWEWYVWDHLVQEFDPTKDNYLGPTGVEDHPELIDINFVSTFDEGGGQAEDWTHANGIDYNPDLDQIVLSVREFSEFWVIDHSTTTAEAAGHTGGNSGKGGDLLYRWGNPQTYDTGTPADRVLYYQHDAKWITPDEPGTGNITVFNNGFGQPGTDLSSVLEIAPPVDGIGNYSLTPGQAYGPASPVWSYTGAEDDFSSIISGTQRLENGNQLITFGVDGTFVEVTSAGVEVWRYVNPFTGGGTLGETDPIPNLGAGGPGLEDLLVNFTFRAIDYPADYLIPLQPPTVIDVQVRGTGFSSDFLTDVENAGAGSADHGYSIPVGNGDQLRPLSWIGVDQVTLTFNQEVNVVQGDLSLTGDTAGNYAFSGFSTAAGTEPGTFEATWTLATPIDSDELTLVLSDSVTSTAEGLALDGEWDNPTAISDPSSQAYPSGDGDEGGPFSFEWNVHPADINGDGAVDGLDANVLSSNWLADPPSPLTADINASGVVDGLDANLVSSNWFEDLFAAGAADAAVDGFIDGFDSDALSAHWLSAADSLALGDLNGDGVVNGLDANLYSTAVQAKAANGGLAAERNVGRQDSQTESADSAIDVKLAWARVRRVTDRLFADDAFTSLFDGADDDGL